MFKATKIATALGKDRDCMVKLQHLTHPKFLGIPRDCTQWIRDITDSTFWLLQCQDRSQILWSHQGDGQH